MHQIELHPDAAIEVEATVSWYEEKAKGLGLEFLNEFEDVLKKIVHSPNFWLKYKFGTYRFFLHRFPYAVIYRSSKKKIQIVAVMHLHRKPFYWRSGKQ